MYVYITYLVHVNESKQTCFHVSEMSLEKRDFINRLTNEIWKQRFASVQKLRPVLK